MGQLDYERARRRLIPSDGATDDLPPAGSWADQRRYWGEYGWGSEGRSRSNRSGISGGPTRPQNLQTTPDVGKELAKYVGHAEHCDFARKSTVQKAEVIAIIQRLLTRCSRASEGCSAHPTSLTLRARRLIDRHTH